MKSPFKKKILTESHSTNMDVSPCKIPKVSKTAINFRKIRFRSLVKPRMVFTVWSVSWGGGGAAAARKPAPIRHLSHSVSRHLADVQKGGGVVLDGGRGRPLQGSLTLGRTEGGRATFYFTRFSIFRCKRRNRQRKLGSLSLKFHSSVFQIGAEYFNVFRWNASVKRCKWPKRAASTVSKSQSRTSILKCTVCWSTRTSRMQKSGENGPSVVLFAQQNIAW